jgi:asparagine synthetase B (glutamine-hydrolysing)
MSGILIHKKTYKPFYNIEKKGIEVIHESVNDFEFYCSILPTSSYNSSSKQIIKYSNGNMLLFDGTIFNLKEFTNSTNDLAYLKNLFSKGWQKKIITQMNKWDGFWSIIYFDKGSNQFYIISDPMGKKQIYYSSQGISNDIKTLIEQDESFFFQTFQIGTSPTYFDYILRALPNTILITSSDNILSVESIKGYYKFRSPSKCLPIPYSLEKSVKNRLNNKMDDITIFVSGGLSSTILIYEVLKSYKKEKIQFLHIENREDKYIDIIEKFFDIKVEIIKFKDIEIDIKDMATTLEIAKYDSSCLALWNLVKKSKNTVILTGYGSSSLFAGYKHSIVKDLYEKDCNFLIYFYNIIINKIASRFKKEIRCPFQSKYLKESSLRLNHFTRKNQGILRKWYKDKIPIEIINREKKDFYYKNEEKIKELYLEEQYQYYNKYAIRLQDQSFNKK